MRVKESSPDHMAVVLFYAANGAALEAMGHDRHGRPDLGRRRRLDALGMRELARGLLKGTP